MQFLKEFSIIWISMFSAGLMMVLAHFAVRKAKHRAYQGRMLTADQAMQVIRAFVSRWTDQKIHDVYAFCQDGKMQFRDPCSCLLGVYSSRVLHVGSVFRQDADLACFEGRHYDNMREQPGMIEVEFAYKSLGGAADSQELRDSRLLDILSLEILRRGVRAECESAIKRIDRTCEDARAVPCPGSE